MWPSGIVSIEGFRRRKIHWPAGLYELILFMIYFWLSYMFKTNTINRTDGPAAVF
jgi:hypothetical protein